MAHQLSHASNGAPIASPISHLFARSTSLKLRNAPLRLPALVLVGGSTAVAIGAWPFLVLGSLVSPALTSQSREQDVGKGACVGTASLSVRAGERLSWTYSYPQIPLVGLVSIPTLLACTLAIRELPLPQSAILSSAYDSSDSALPPRNPVPPLRPARLAFSPSPASPPRPFAPALHPLDCLRLPSPPRRLPLLSPPSPPRRPDQAYPDPRRTRSRPGCAREHRLHPVGPARVSRSIKARRLPPRAPSR